MLSWCVWDDDAGVYFGDDANTAQVQSLTAADR
jgi:hypothetical protein